MLKSSQIALERITDYGLLLHFYEPGVAIEAKQAIYKIDFLKGSITLLHFSFPHDGEVYLTTLSEDGYYMYAMVAVDKKNWELLRFPMK